MYLKQVVLLFFLVFGLSSTSQNIFINYDIDTSVFKVSEPLKLWKDFLNTKDDAKGSKYWNEAEVKKYGNDSYFLIENELQFGMDNYLKFLSYTEVKILSIRVVNDYYKVTSLMEFKPRDGKSNIQYVFHVYAGKEKGILKLYNAIDINTKLNFSNTTIGFIKFHYPKSHNFNSELAKKQNDFLFEISENFNVPISDTIDYYFASTNAEIQAIKGFDFLIGDSGDQVPTGKADTKNRIVYSSGLAEYYPHEFIHILLNPHYPNCHLWMNEGVATRFGMSRGENLTWHLKRVNQHLIEHQEIDLNNLLELRSLDQYTDYRYALGGFIIDEAYKKGGYVLLKKIMSSGKTDADFYNALEKYLGVKRQDINVWIRGELLSNY